MLRVLRGRTTSRSSVTPGRYGEPLLVVCYSMIVAACVLIAGVYGSLTANRRIRRRWRRRRRSQRSGSA